MPMQRRKHFIERNEIVGPKPGMVDYKTGGSLESTRSRALRPRRQIFRLLLRHFGAMLGKAAH
jgi:hypothetical protein